MDKKGMVEALINYYTDGNKAKFAVLLGVKPQTISAWVSRNTFDAELIYAKCRGVSASWLLTSCGDMLSSTVRTCKTTGENAQAITGGHHNAYIAGHHNHVEQDNHPTPSLADQVEIARLRERVAALEDAVTEKNERLNDLKETIAILREKIHQ